MSRKVLSPWIFSHWSLVMNSVYRPIVSPSAEPMMQPWILSRTVAWMKGWEDVNTDSNSACSARANGCADCLGEATCMKSAMMQVKRTVKGEEWKLKMLISLNDRLHSLCIHNRCLGRGCLRDRRLGWWLEAEFRKFFDSAFCRISTHASGFPQYWLPEFKYGR